MMSISLGQAVSCEVQYGQRVAGMGMAVQQKAQSFVVGAAGGAAGLRWSLLACRMMMKITNAMIRKLTTVFTNWP